MSELMMCLTIAALSETGDLYVWGWNESGQLGYPYNCEGSQSLFLFFEHACQCPERKHLEGEHLQEENKDTEESQGVQTEVRSNKKVNPKRRKEVINVQASPVLLHFWTEDVNITNVQCGDRHTLYMLGEWSCLAWDSTFLLHLIEYILSKWIVCLFQT